MKNKLLTLSEKIFAFALVCVLTVSITTPAAAEADAKAVVTKEEVIAVSEKAVETVKENLTETEDVSEEEEALYGPEDLQFMGVIWHEGCRYTWYSEKVLPGGGLAIPGRHVDDEGYVCDEDGFICVASRDLAKGTEVDLPFGKPGKVYDWCAISGTIDIYVSW